MLWDIHTKFLPVKDLMRFQLSTKFERCCLKNKPAMPLTFSNFSRARQAHFLSYDLQIWWKVITFKGTYVIWFWCWYLSRYGIWKNVKSCTLHLTELFVQADSGGLHLDAFDGPNGIFRVVGRKWRGRGATATSPSFSEIQYWPPTWPSQIFEVI